MQAAYLACNVIRSAGRVGCQPTCESEHRHAEHANRPRRLQHRSGRPDCREGPCVAEAARPQVVVTVPAACGGDRFPVQIRGLTGTVMDQPLQEFLALIHPGAHTPPPMGYTVVAEHEAMRLHVSCYSF